MGEKIHEIRPVYCEHIPKDVEPGVLYISNEYQIAIHLCACGCGGKTATRINRPEGDCWTFTDNGGKVTLRPSIGNWSGENPYHAHYLITDNKIEWC
jgi:hypothetical protein